MPIGEYEACTCWPERVDRAPEVFQYASVHDGLAERAGRIGTAR